MKADPADKPRKKRAAAGEGAGRRKASKKPAGGRRSWGRRLVLWGASLVIWAGIAVGGLVAWYAMDLPDIDAATAVTRRPSLTFVSADGEVFATYGDIYGRTVRLAELPPHLPRAVLATEDRRFYDHFGLDPIGLARAAFANLRAGRVVQGGSTITQQLAKNLFLTPERSLKRKVQELLMAIWLENRLTKDQILELYLNRVYLGAGTYGVDAAARRYFGVAARELSLYRSALVAGLLKAPSRYNPLANPELSRQRTRQVLANMVAAGYITEAQARAAEAKGPGELRDHPPGGRYFADWLYERAADLAVGADADLVVQTTIDMDLQRRVEKELAAVLSGPGRKAGATQGAVVVLSPDGAVLAMAGGRDYEESQFNRATQALRQPGSAFKPFVYLAALEQGMTPDDMVEDAPVRIGKWRPGNFDNRYLGPVTLAEAVARSINTVAVRVTERVGHARVVEAARRLGIASRLPEDASIALGTGEVTLVELAGAYATFANGGEGVWVHGIREIRDRNGKVVWRGGGGGAGRVVQPPHVAMMNDMLAGVIDYGTGRSAGFGRPAAGKTGTTQDYKDAWFLGYTADYVAGVWIGNDDGAPMKKVTGGGLPAQLWKKVMQAAHGGLPPRPLPGGGYRPPESPALAGERGAQPPTAAYEGQPQYSAEALEGIWNNLVRSLTGR